MKHIFIIGGTTFDHIVSLPVFPEAIPQTIHNCSFFETTGSTGTGKAIALTKLGIPNTLYSILGNDIFGEQILQHLKKESVDLIYDIDPRGTERHVNIMNANGDRISMFITQSSEHLDIRYDAIKNAIQKSDIIVLNIIAYCKDIIPTLQQYDKPIWTDLHDYNDGNTYHEPFIEAADHIFLSSDNLPDHKQTMQQLINRGKELVVCTHGKKGSTSLTKDGIWTDIPALEGISIIDTNGAGDSYFSGFLYAYLNGKSLIECMKYGTLSGGLCVTSQQIVSDKMSAVVLDDLYQKNY